MNRFWSNIIQPIIKSINANYVIEIGSDTGINTQNILEYCMKYNAHMASIDPLPKFDIDEFKAKYGDKFEIYMELSLSRLPLLKDYDVILLDGDHNWYTVYNELKIIEKSFKNKKFPVVFLHDVGWPYARRDLYYNPENIPEAYRQPYKKLGIYPGQINLRAHGGLNTHLNNAIYENNPKNGVLTAVEDFIRESDLEFSFKVISAFHGLCILFLKDDNMENIIEEVIESANLLNDLEEERVKLTIAHSEEKVRTNSLKKGLTENKAKLEYIETLFNQTADKLQYAENKLKSSEEKEKQLGNIKIQFNQITDKLDITEEKLRSSKKLAIEKENQLENMESRLYQTKGQLKSSNDLMKETEDKLEQTKNQLEVSYQLMDKKEKQLERTKVQLNHAEQKLKHVENQLNSSSKLIQEKQDFIADMEKEEKKAVNKLKLQIETLKASLIEMEYLSNKDRSITQRLISKFPGLYMLFNINETGIKNTLLNIKGYRSIKKDKLVDIGFYLKNNKSVRVSGMDPILHYIYHGFKEGKKPNPTFNGNYYLTRYKDVKKSNLNPLIHYSLYGKNEGRKTWGAAKNQNNINEEHQSDYDLIISSGLFDVNWYMDQYKEVDYSQIDPAYHYLREGAKKGYNPNPFFDTNWYLKNNPDVANANMNPLVHFIRYGAAELRSPHPLFSVSRYLNENHDVAASGMNPLSHYLKYGIKEGRNLISEIPPENNKYKEIMDKNKSIINLHHFDENSPLVSIIILNRNGINHLKRLFKCFKENIHYPSYELIVVDNDSCDESIQFLEGLKENLPLKIIKNNENKTFSQANNEAVEIASGEYILLLNNDVEPTYGWLNQMMQTALQSDDIGAVGARLVYPDCSHSAHNKHNSFKLQHTGIGFKVENGFIKPYNLGSSDSFSSKDYMERERAAVTAAALLVKKDKYIEVQGLDEGYNYGYEDVDLCLKLLKDGYRNVYCPKAVLFHYEFGTQETDEKSEVKERRLKNKELFIQKWNKWLKKEYFKDKLKNNKLFSEKSLKVALVVTEVGDNASAGDYFTALELGEGFKKLGWDISFLSRKGPGDWYDVDKDVDILISLLDAYDPRKIKGASEYLIKIAWARNWFSRWAENPALSTYDMVMASSETACNYIEENSGIKALLLPIATNTARFNPYIGFSEGYTCDYCFTGSYWNDPREIIEMLEPATLPYDFKLYGKNWDQLDKFKDYYNGFVNYFKLPEVYASTKIVIDDANRVTKEYGAVNSRVYDALASGALVLTNGVIGAQETFNGKLPSFSSKEELNELISYYLDNEDERLAKVKELQEMVFKDHTYQKRALRIKEILEDFLVKNKIAIKIPAPDWEGVQNWGDYHLALGLKKEFERKGCAVKLHVLKEWNKDSHCDIVLVLRGLSRYVPQKQHLNIMWNISHPDKVSLDEYNQYDHVFIASEYWAHKINKLADVHVEPLLQCTDPELFYSDHSAEYNHDILFVGNSRKVFRKIIKDLLPTSYDLAVYGKNWEKFIDPKYIKGEHIPNSQLRKAYSSCKILLNDHWEDMREKGFVSNRLFDGFACGAFIISDKVKGAQDVFGEALVTYDTPEELKELIDNYLKNEKERNRKSKNGRSSVIKEYSYQNRAQHILEVVYTFNKAKDSIFSSKIGLYSKTFKNAAEGK